MYLDFSDVNFTFSSIWILYWKDIYHVEKRVPTEYLRTLGIVFRKSIYFVIK